MKINPLDPRTSSTPSVKERSSPAEASSGSGAQVARTSSASVSLSPVAMEAVSPGGVSALVGAFDAEKVDRVRQAVNDGSYRVNPGVIADRLIEFALERLNMAAR